MKMHIHSTSNIQKGTSMLRIKPDGPGTCCIARTTKQDVTTRALAHSESLCTGGTRGVDVGSSCSLHC